MKRILLIVLAAFFAGGGIFFVLRTGRQVETAEVAAPVTATLSDFPYERSNGDFTNMFEEADRAREQYDREHPAKDPKDIPPISVDLAYWQQQNSRIRGYLYSPGTIISYPIVQGTDNYFYLDHDIYGNADINGCIMMEHLNKSDYSDNNTILYGHHMKDGSMLASIDRYKDASFYPSHPYMFLYTTGGIYRLDLVAGFSCPHNDEVFCTAFTDEQIRRFMGRSTFASTVTDPIGPYITLCTCSYEHDNWRYVVICQMVPIA